MVMANERPEYQDKIYLASFLAPVAFVDHMKAPIKYLAPFSNQIGVSSYNEPTQLLNVSHIEDHQCLLPTLILLDS